MKRRVTIGIDEVGRAASPKTRRASPNPISIGIDEVGRGALAGPVVLCAVVLKGRMRWSHPRLGRIRDSKKLTAKRREQWFDFLSAHPCFDWLITKVGSRVIDRINISRAADRGSWRLAKRLVSNGQEVFFWLDGGLKLPAGFPHRALIRGDEKMPLIAAASIIAKVSRDRMMVRLAKKFPRYHFDVHKGYGTRRHKQALAERGPTEIHRMTFLRRLKKVSTVK
ncbi:MAG: ribonuclease HII [Candidatus Sungbacteria bacterium]|nr:ribonuclease HII [Candidatus Sungbacteria bacterium]